MDEVKEEIKARLPVEDVVGQYIELKRAGRTWKGRSPWGVDKTPSFMVSPEKGIWHDFSANKGGDIFTFLMEVEGISFREALEKLATQAGVELVKYGHDDKKISMRKKRAKECLELACRYYQICLTKNREVCEYVFYKRGLNRGTVKEFRIGYAPQNKEALVRALQNKGYTKEEMQDAGLLNRFSGDLFRGRMMVPFVSTVGEVIGFTGRILGKGEPKYLNTPETLLFNKGRFIFGLSQAKEAIRQSGYIVVVEGNMDVISSHQAGVKEAVATSGTAMTELHLKAMSRLTNDIRLAYDGDVAGVAAAERAIYMAGKLGINLSVISNYQGAKDPDELIQRDPKLWQEAVREKVPATDWLLGRYEERLDLNSGAGKREYSDVAMKLIGYIEDKVERTHYEQIVAKRLEVSVEDLRAKKINDEPMKRYKTVKGDEKGSELLRGVEDNLLAILVYGGEAGGQIRLEIPEDEVKLGELEMVYRERYEKWGEKELGQEVKALWKRREVILRQKKKEELQSQMENEDDEERKEEILREIMKLK